jgi:V-type H+-transporting ATPase subunit C
VDQYLRTFQWNKVKYRADKPIADLIDSLQKVRISNRAGRMKLIFV